MEAHKLNCGYRVIPFIVDGEYNGRLVPEDLDRGKLAIELLKVDCQNDKLSKNYTAGLKLDAMALYSVLWDDANEKPVMLTGAQPMSAHCCRLFSRYYLFNDYRTSHATHLYDKVDNFETDLLHLQLMKSKYPLLFWSREYGPSFFKRIKKVRDDIFNEWSVYPEEIELVWRNNHQSIIYTGDVKYIEELRFTE